MLCSDILCGKMNIECDVGDHSLTGLDTKVSDPRAVCWLNVIYVTKRGVRPAVSMVSVQ